MRCGRELRRVRGIAGAVVLVSLTAALAAPRLGSRTDFQASSFCRTYQCQRIAQDTVIAGITQDRYRLLTDPSQVILPVIAVTLRGSTLAGVSFEYGGADVRAWLGDGDTPNAMLRDLVKDLTGASLTPSAIMGFAERCQASGTRVTLPMAAAKLTCLRYLGEYRMGWSTVIRLRR